MRKTRNKFKRLMLNALSFTILLNILQNNYGVQSLRSEGSVLNNENFSGFRFGSNTGGNFASLPIVSDNELNLPQEKLPPTTTVNENTDNIQHKNNPTIETAKFVDGHGNKYEAAVINSCPYRCACLGEYLQCGKLQLDKVPVLPDWVNRLDLAGNKLDDNIENSIGNLTNLEILNLKRNRLRKIPLLHGLVSLEKLNLSNNKIETITLDSLQLLKRLKYLDLSRNIISIIKPNSFPANNRITNINLNYNRLTTLKEGCLDELKELVELQLNDNNLFTIANGIFKELNNLKKLYLNGNHIDISYLTFQGLDELRTLRIRLNKLRQLRDGVFHPLKSIEAIELDSNQISHLGRQGFYNLTSLQSLSMSNNTIHKIDSDTWEFTQYLQSLDLSNNFLVEFKSQHLGKLKILNLSENQIQHIADGTFENMQYLEQIYLSYNKLSWIIEDSSSSPFKALKKLQKLDLSANNIKTINKNSFAGLGVLQHLSLSKNNLTTIQFNAFENLQHLKYLDLSSDYFLCDCNLQWLLSWLKIVRSKGDTGSNINVVCDYPHYLRGRNLLSLLDTDFMCNESPKPRLIQEPSNQLAIKGTNVSLECSAISSAKSEIRIQWRRDNIDILQNEIETDIKLTSNSNSTLISSFLHLSNVSRDHSGKYQCVVVNAFGTTYSSKFKITVATYPGFRKVPTNITIDSGSTARLDCSAFGEPMPEIAWQKDGGNDFPAARERRMRLMPADNAFFIMNATPFDMGVYTCTAETPAGIITANATLIVNESPSFVRKMQNKEVVIGETVVLECMAAGSPKPSIKWYKDEKQLTMTERHFFTADKQLLVIVDTRSSDTGNYKCELQNNIAAIVDFALLTIVKGGFSKNVVNVEEMTGIVIITIFCCAIGTSIIWVVIIYQTKKTNEESNSMNETALTTMMNCSTIVKNNNETSFNSVSNEREHLNGAGDGSVNVINDANVNNNASGIINTSNAEENGRNRITQRLDFDDDDTVPLYQITKQQNHYHLQAEKMMGSNHMLLKHVGHPNITDVMDVCVKLYQFSEENDDDQQYLKRENIDEMSSKDSGTGSDTIKDGSCDLIGSLPLSPQLDSMHTHYTKVQLRQKKNYVYLQPCYQLNPEQHENSNSSTTPVASLSVYDNSPTDELLTPSNDSCSCVDEINSVDCCKTIDGDNTNHYNEEPISINCSSKNYNNLIKNDKYLSSINNSISLPLVTTHSHNNCINTLPDPYHNSNRSLSPKHIIVDSNIKITPTLTSLKNCQNSIMPKRYCKDNDNHKIPSHCFGSFQTNGAS